MPGWIDSDRWATARARSPRAWRGCGTGLGAGGRGGRHHPGVVTTPEPRAAFVGFARSANGVIRLERVAGTSGGPWPPRGWGGIAPSRASSPVLGLPHFTLPLAARCAGSRIRAATPLRAAERPRWPGSVRHGRAALLKHPLRAVAPESSSCSCTIPSACANQGPTASSTLICGTGNPEPAAKAIAGAGPKPPDLGAQGLRPASLQAVQAPARGIRPS